MDKLNKRFRLYRIEMNITQEELSQMSGVSVYTIKNFERGSDIRVSTLMKLLQSLGIKNSIEEIIPDMTNRPSYRAKEAQGKIYQRAHKKKMEEEWTWGE